MSEEAIDILENSRFSRNSRREKTKQSIKNQNNYEPEK